MDASARHLVRRKSLRWFLSRRISLDSLGHGILVLLSSSAGWRAFVNIRSICPAKRSASDIERQQPSLEGLSHVVALSPPLETLSQPPAAQNGACLVRLSPCGHSRPSPRHKSVLPHLSVVN